MIGEWGVIRENVSKEVNPLFRQTCYRTVTTHHRVLFRFYAEIFPL